MTEQPKDSAPVDARESSNSDPGPSGQGSQSDPQPTPEGEAATAQETQPSQPLIDAAPATEPETGQDQDQDVKEDEKPPLAVKIEDAGPARKKLSITVPEQRIDEKREERFEKLKDEAQVPGFRKGRAPMRLLEKRFGSAVKQEVRAQILSEAYQQAIEENELVVIGEPDLSDIEQIELPEKGPLEFDLEIEVVPEFELPEFEGIPVTQPTTTVTDADVDAEVKRLALQNGRFVQVTEGTVAEGDYVEGDLRILEGDDDADDAPLIEHLPGATTQVPGESLQYRGHLAGIVVEDLGRRLTGRATGDQVRLSLTGPSMHEDERIKGKPITMVLRIDRVRRVEPATHQQLAEMSGLETPEEFTEAVRMMLTQQYHEQAQSQIHQQICRHLLDNIEMDLPTGFSGRQIQRLLDRRRVELAMEGVPEEEIEQRIAERRSEDEEASRRELKLFFILGRIAEKLDLDVSENEVNTQIVRIAQQQNRRPERLRSELMQSGMIEQIYMRLRDQKVLNALLAKANVTEADAGAADSAASDRQGSSAAQDAPAPEGGSQPGDAAGGGEGGDEPSREVSG